MVCSFDSPQNNKILNGNLTYRLNPISPLLSDPDLLNFRPTAISDLQQLIILYYLNVRFRQLLGRALWQTQARGPSTTARGRALRPQIQLAAVKPCAILGRICSIADLA